MGGEPGDSIPGSILVFKSVLEFPKEVIPGSESHGGASDCVFTESVSPGQSRSFNHVGEGEQNFLHIVVIGFFIDCKVQLDGVHLQDGGFVGAIEGFWFAELELGGFDDGGQH